VSRSKDIGTRFESMVVRYLQANGWPYAERRALAGVNDLGDITGTPGLVWECKGGRAAHTAGDGQVAKWLVETERERMAAAAEIGVLVLARAGCGEARLGSSWAILPAAPFLDMRGPGLPDPAAPVRVHLSTATALLRLRGYGTQVAS
jgi:hypothetical protein